MIFLNRDQELNFYISLDKEIRRGRAGEERQESRESRIHRNTVSKMRGSLVGSGVTENFRQGCSERSGRFIGWDTSVIFERAA